MEIEPYRREVLLRRQRDDVLDLFPIWDDVRTFDGRPWRGKVDVVTAGFPCQPWSSAGKRQGQGDERNLWPDTMRIVCEVGPRYVLLENVPGLLAHEYFGTVLGQLAEGGYDCRWDCFQAADEGAPHIRDRLFILGYTNTNREPTMPVHDEMARLSTLVTNADGGRRQSRGAKFAGQERTTAPVGDSGKVADAARANVGNAECSPANVCATQGRSRHTTRQPGWWDAEPGVGRVVDGLAHRVDRLKAIGDGQVPAVVVRAWDQLAKEILGHR